MPGGAARAHPARPQEGPPEQRRIDTPPGRWLPRHQPWNASAHALGGTGRSVDELAAQLDELGELRQAGLLTDEEFARQRAWLLGT